ncbi:hypothetical protein [Arthrobacter crystallopoietes]|uniref:Uncharacterized protein n=1 Tax=Crystallibacter crystallopoietes TaxID=37928 RepID=A0A1H1EW34_9MICC|nr:hypothetical protein [Arthrobacter crystallopoietes]AUI49773.1 hypothetical protein AC20117_01990 [Arthrobacter crystallopoietes]SDQ92366.1 hypothetical protein SAMN04489742_3097 [Arthrobacter crystallopoietes]
MSSRQRYLVRSMRVAAGSFLTAATVATLTVIGSGPAAASSSTANAVHSHLAVAGTGTFIRRESDLPVKQPAEARITGGRQDAERESRLAGLRAEMDQAVAWGMVTQRQADGFITQLASRIDRGF